MNRMKIAELLFQMAADTAALRNDMQEAKSVVNAAIGDMKRDWENFSKILKGAGLLAVFEKVRSAAAETFGASVEFLDKMDEAAIRTGSSVEKLSTLLTAAASSGVGIDGMVGITERLTRSMVGAEKETSKAAQAFKALKIDPTQFTDAVDLQLALADSLAKYGSGLDKIKLMQAIVGRGAGEYAKYLEDLAKQGADAVKVTTEQAAAAARYKDNLALLHQQGEIVKASFFQPLIQMLANATTAFNDAKKAGLSFFEALQSIPFGNTKDGQDIAFMLQSRVDQLAKLEQRMKELQSSKMPDFYNKDRIASLQKEIDLARTRVQLALDLQRQQPGWQAGFKPAPPAPKLEGEDKPEKEKDYVSMAQEKLLAIQKMADAYRDMTEYQKVLYDLNSGDLKVIAEKVPKFREQVLEAARLADVQKHTSDALKEEEKRREAMVQKAQQWMKEDQEAEDRKKKAAEDEIANILKQTGEAKQAEMARLTWKLDVLLMEEKITAEMHKQAVEIVNGIKNQKDDAKKEIDELQKTIEGFGRQTSKAFADMLFGGSGSWSDLIKKFATEVIEQYLYKNIFKGMFEALGKGDFSQWSTAFSGLFGGGRAAGGDVVAGRTYLVGEQGPELLTMGASGHVTPNSALGKSVSINNVYNIDSRSDRSSIISEIERRSRATEARISDLIQRGNRGFTR